MGLASGIAVHRFPPKSCPEPTLLRSNPRCPVVIVGKTALLYTDGPELQNQRCGSEWAVFHQDGGLPSPGVVSGSKAKIYDAELHAIQKRLLRVFSANWPPARILGCADNRSVLARLTGGNPKNSEFFARNALTVVGLLRKRGWSVSGLWIPAHCGIPEGERVDAQSKQGAQGTEICRYT